MTLTALFMLCRRARYISAENQVNYAFCPIGDTLYVLFEQSNGLEDWMNNLDFIPKPSALSRPMAHRGFLRVYGSAAEAVEKTVQGTSAHAITVAGYSHGGALASLCYNELWEAFPALRPRLQGVSFGGPRVFYCPRGCVWPDGRETQFLNVCAVGDPVAHLPPAALGYRHIGRTLSVGAESGARGIDAHRPENYEAALRMYERHNLDKYPNL